VPYRKLAGFVVAAMILIQLGTVASHWGDVLARRPDFAAMYRAANQLRAAASANGSEVSPPSGTSSETSRGMAADTLHPPFEMLLFLPLTFLEYRFAYAFWVLCNIAMLWAVPILLWEELGTLQHEFHFIAIIYGSIFAVLLCLVQGQDAILLLLLLTLCFRSLKRGKDLTAGICLAFALFKFQIAIPIAFFFLVQRNWKFLKGFATAGSVLALTSLTIVGWRGFLRYFTVVSSVGLAKSGASIDDPTLMPNLRGLLLSTVGRLTSTVGIRVMIVVFSIVILGSAVAWLLKNSNIETRYSFAVAVAVSALISYHFFPHNACILLLPQLLIANDLLSRERSTVWKRLLALAILAIYLAPNLLPLNWAMPVVGGASLLFIYLLLSIPSARETHVIESVAMQGSITELQKGAS
jgi:hypothetical protein